MALDTIPDNGISVLTREKMRSLWLRCFRIRQPEASTEQDTQPWVDASVAADVLAPMSMNARTIGRSIPLSEVSGDRLDQRLKELGMPERFPETGSQGSVTIQASSTGVYIPADVQLQDLDNGLRFKTAVAGTYQDLFSVPIVGIDAGTQTNLKPGTKMIWLQGIPGLFQTCFVTEQSDGSGLSGGRAAESDDEVRKRISDTLANPAAAGNDAAYQRLMENSRGHGVAVQKAFTYPAINGAGTIGGAFTMKPATAGGSRRPNATQIALVQAYVTGQMPADDTYLPITLVPYAIDISFDVNWAKGAAGWYDIYPWPSRYDLTHGAIVVSAATNSSNFTLATDNGVYTGVRQPSPGNNIAFYDNSGTGFFRRKKILTVTGTGPWVCTVDTSNAVSDTTYTPVIGQRAFPWSDSLQTLIEPIAEYFGTLGPGEQIANFFDPGLRQRRNPAPPKQWPSTISSKIETGILNLTSVNDVRTIEGLGTPTPIGAAGAFSHILELKSISVFPLQV